MAQSQHVVKVQDPVVAVVEASLKVGAACGCAGFLFGGTSGILKSTTPFLFATASSIQTFALGTTFWACRGTFLQLRGGTATRTPGDYVQASTLAGGLSGGVVALVTRSRRNVLPATVMWSLFGCVGQLAYNRYSAAPREQQQPKVGFWQRMAEKSWSPVTFMSNDEYAEKLREKLLKVDVEIAILDDKIAALRQQQQHDDEAATAEETKPKPVP